MIINNNEIINAIYDNEILYDYDEFDLSNEQVIRELESLNDLKIRIRDIKSFMERKDNQPSGYEQLLSLVTKCKNLKTFRITSYSRETVLIDELFKELMKLSKIERINIEGFFTDYSHLREEIKNRKDKHIPRIIISKLLNSSDELFYAISDETTKNNLIVNNFKNEEYKELNDSIRFKRIPLSLYKKYRSYLYNVKETAITINNVSELDINGLAELRNDPSIKKIIVKCGNATKNDDSGIYTFDEYYQIRKVIDNIISNIKVPDANNQNREKIIFAQIYKILGANISYDHYAIMDENASNKELQNNCRNLKNGLLGVQRNGKIEYLTVCAGYATILQNLCACFNIKCDYICSKSREVKVPGREITFGQKKYENGTNDPMGHAYNAVYLDGQAYLCDLTWDSKSMKANNYIANNFLCSYEEFLHSHRNVGFDKDNIDVISQQGEKKYDFDEKDYSQSLSIKEQIELFGTIIKGSVEEMSNINYLAGFVSEYLSFVKQCKGEDDIREYIRIINTVKALEQYILSDEFKKRATWTALSIPVNVGDVKKDIIFYNGRDMTSNAAQKEVEGGSKWKAR